MSDLALSFEEEEIAENSGPLSIAPQKRQYCSRNFDPQSNHKQSPACPRSKRYEVRITISAAWSLTSDSNGRVTRFGDKSFVHV